ncbi:DinB family protein [Radicibacter daui]|uniref:DinB family protein n=1 Tax=Radicibacter daui TaxID=3064829 RepID=UPI004046D4DF
MSHSMLLALARNNTLANFRLYEAVGQLTSGAVKARRTSFFPSIFKTLCHIFEVDRYYHDAVIAGGLAPQLLADWQAERRAFDDFTALRAGQAAMDRSLVAATEALGADGIDREVLLLRSGGRIFRERASDVLLHIFTHDIHHRGQVHAMMAGTAVPPPQLDEFFLKQDAPFRGVEMAALGFEEQA